MRTADRFSIEAFRASGFEGFAPIRRIRSSGAEELPAVPGVYIVLRPDASAPRFLAVSPAGWYQGRDPTVAATVLRARWIASTALVYVGKATAGRQHRRHLRKRVTEFVDFGAGEPEPHRGGRYVWQVAGAGRLLMAWKPAADPTSTENAILRRFAAAHGQYPFANIAGPRG
jgi:hypothetical protein